MISFKTLLFLSSTGFLGGFVDSIAGGGGLITVPALLMAGIPPHITLGTNKLAATCGSFNAARIFIQKKIFNPILWQTGLIACGLGGVVGVLLNQIISAKFLLEFLPILIIFVIIYISFFAPKLNNEGFLNNNFKPPQKSSLFMGGLLGFYDGFLGPGTGSFWTTLAMSIYKIDMLSASGVARVMNFMSNLSALIVFMGLHDINYSVGAVMGAGLFIGAQLGSRCAIYFGAKFIRPLFLIVVSILVLKLILQNLHII